MPADSVSANSVPADIAIACGDGFVAQPSNLPGLVRSELVSQELQALPSVGEPLAGDLAAREPAIAITYLRPGRWVGYVSFSDKRTVPANTVLTSPVLASTVVKRLRVAGHSAVLGPPDSSHLPSFINRNSATYVNNDLAICFPWAPCDAAQVVEIDPGAAFGAGSHPSTVLAARELASALICPVSANPVLGQASSVQARSSQSVLDVGCGSGVLALVAARCGAAEVLGIDIDPAAVSCAQRNAKINGLEHIASFSIFPVSELTQTYDVVVANIGASTLGDLAPELTARLAPGARLILSGISAAQVSRLQALFTKLGSTKLEHGVIFEAPKRLDDWCVLVGAKR